MSRPYVNIFGSYPKLKKNEVFTSISYRDINKITSASDLKFLCSDFSRDTVAFYTFDHRLRDYL